MLGYPPAHSGANEVDLWWVEMRVIQVFVPHFHGDYHASPVINSEEYAVAIDKLFHEVKDDAMRMMDLLLFHKQKK